MKFFQRGGFVVGLIIGLLVGLALALGVALYVTKVPIPFIDKLPQRTAEQDAAEAERNKNWDPNAPLTSKPAPRAAPGGAAPAPAVPAEPAPAAGRDPAAILSGQPAVPASAVPRSTKPGADPFSYYVQAGAYGRPEDAEQQRARLAMMGLGAKVTEREQSGRTVYRVRLGPFDQREEADAAQERLQGSGVESALVRVER
jgi:cell division protein FtsN